MRWAETHAPPLLQPALPSLHFISWAIRVLVESLSWVEFHCPGIEVTEPRVPPPHLINVLIDRQESDKFMTENVADEDVLTAPRELAVVFYTPH
jgi:hypothetical protein